MLKIKELGAHSACPQLFHCRLRFVAFSVSFIMLLQSGAGCRVRCSVFWEWMCFFSSMLWLLGHFVFFERGIDTLRDNMIGT